MRKLFWLVLIIGLVGAFMTNPNEQDFQEFLIEKYKKENKEGDLLKDLLDKLATPAAFSDTLSLKTEDYKLCSTYTIKNINGKQETYLGLYKKFVKL